MINIKNNDIEVIEIDGSYIGDLIEDIIFNESKYSKYIIKCSLVNRTYREIGLDAPP